MDLVADSRLGFAHLMAWIGGEALEYADARVVPREIVTGAGGRGGAGVLRAAAALQVHQTGGRWDARTVRRGGLQSIGVQSIGGICSVWKNNRGVGGRRERRKIGAGKTGRNVKDFFEPRKTVNE